MLIVQWPRREKLRNSKIPTRFIGVLRIHDEVYQKELDGSERARGRLPQDNEPDVRFDQSDYIDSQLELKESSDVVIDVSSPLSPLAGFDYRGKVSKLSKIK